MIKGKKFKGRKAYLQRERELKEEWNTIGRQFSEPMAEQSPDVPLDYDTRIGTKLWGASSVDTPLRPEIMDQVARAATGHAGVGPMGLTEKLDGVRQAFLQEAYIEDKGATNYDT